MTEPFKNLIHAGTVADAGAAFQRVWRGFDRTRFEALALPDLDSLELKARAMRLADALQATLPDDFGHTARLIEATLAPAREPDRPDAEPDLAALRSGPDGLAGWVGWSLGEVVARTGQADVPRALACLRELTQRFSAEFAIRPFLRDHPGPTFDTLSRWTTDPSAHVRRLVSEGSRPRLPWGLRLQALVQDPGPCWPLLRALQDDPSPYVRRSVANHLNDIAKDHPDAVAHWVQTQLDPQRPARTALLRHASRSLIKQGHAATLAAWGLGQAFQGQVSLTLSPHAVPWAGDLGVCIGVQAARNAAPQRLVVDYAVHHAGASGPRPPKVFKGWSLTLQPGEHRQLDKRHSLRPVTTRRLYPGAHTVDVRVNGQVLAQAGFELGSP